MKLLQITRDALLKPLQIVTGIVEKRHTLPILSNVLIEKKDGQLDLIATDLEIQVSTTCEAAGSAQEDHSLTVSARKLQDILRSLPEDAEVILDAQASRVQLKAGKSRFNLQTLPAADFPMLGDAGAPLAQIQLTQKALRELLSLAQFAMAQQDIRYYLNGLLMVTDGSAVRVVATDGHRLAFCEAMVEGASLARQEVIIPRKTVLELQRLLGDSDDAVLIDVAANQVRFRFGDVEMISKLVEGKFPDYQRVIPTGYTRSTTIARDQLASALGRASILTSDKFRGVRLSLAPGQLKIQTSNAEQEEAIEELEVDYDSDPLEIGFNVGYLQDVLGNLKTEQVSIAFGDANTSALLTVPGDESFRYVVMPMRI